MDSIYREAVLRPQTTCIWSWLLRLEHSPAVVFCGFCALVLVLSEHCATAALSESLTWNEITIGVTKKWATSISTTVQDWILSFFRNSQYWSTRKKATARSRFKKKGSFPPIILRCGVVVVTRLFSGSTPPVLYALANFCIVRWFCTCNVSYCFQLKTIVIL